jgi:hypothetical protein
MNCTDCLQRVLINFIYDFIPQNDRGHRKQQYLSSIYSAAQPTRCNAIQCSLLLSVLYIFRAVFPLIIRGSKTVYATSVLVKLVCCYRQPGWVGTQVWQITMLYIQFLSSWWWAKKPLETCKALTTIKNIVWRCIPSVVLKNTLAMHGPMNVRNSILPSVISVVLMMKREANLNTYRVGAIYLTRKTWKHEVMSNSKGCSCCMCLGPVHSS